MDDFYLLTMRQVYEALKVKGYSPINQIVGYILSEDPTYITAYQGARHAIVKLDRDELLLKMVFKFFQDQAG